MALPNWLGASHVYSECYKLLERMAQEGHVTRHRIRRKWYCIVSQTMRDIITALDKGDEETLKHVLLNKESFISRRDF